MTDPLAASAPDENPYKSPLANSPPHRAPARPSPLRKAHWAWVANVSATFIGGGAILIFVGMYMIAHTQNVLDAVRDFAGQPVIEALEHSIIVDKCVCVFGGFMALIGAATPVVARFKPQWVIKLSRIKPHHTS